MKYNVLKHKVTNKNILLFLFILMSYICVYPQGAAINTTGANPDASAMLDITSTNTGLLIPRMAEAQKNLIQAPATGLMIYQTDGVSGFWYYNGSLWVQAIGPAGSAGATGNTGATGPLVSGTAGQTLRHDGNGWVANSNIFNSGTNVGIGTANPNTSAILDLSSTTMGVLMPRMTTAERNNISNPAQGLLIINTTTNCFEFYLGTLWQTIACGCASAPAAPTAGTHIPSAGQIIWNWNSVSGAVGYKWNTVNDYNTATDLSASLSYTEGGLTGGTSYTRYVWAYNTCGNSTVTTLTQSTPFNCGTSPVNFTYNGSSVTYGSAAGQNGTCWLDRNLGATAVATAYNHSAGYGDWFQWGRLDDGHQIRTSGTTTVVSNTDVPGHSYFILAVTSSYNYDWHTPQNNNLWQGVAGSNNPCPSGWRISTETELNNERASWTNQNYNGAIASSLKLSAGGRRLYNTGDPNDVDGYGYYWSSTINGTDARFLTFGSTSATFGTYRRTYGMSIRCIKD